MSNEWSDKEVVDYCDAHCETDRGLIHRDHLNRLLALAGYTHKVEREWSQPAESDVKEVCRKAREKMKGVTLDV